MQYFCLFQFSHCFLYLKCSESFIISSYLQQQVLQCCPGVFTSACPGVNQRGQKSGQPLQPAVLSHRLSWHPGMF